MRNYLPIIGLVFICKYAMQSISALKWLERQIKKSPVHLSCSSCRRNHHCYTFCSMNYSKSAKKLPLRWSQWQIFQPSLTSFPVITSLSSRRSNQSGFASVVGITLNCKVIFILNRVLNTGHPIGSVFALLLYNLQYECI